MKSNKGSVLIVVMLLIIILGTGAFLYVQLGYYDVANLKFFSMFDKKITLDFSDHTPLPVSAPLVNTGSDIVINYPQTSVTLKAKATAPDGGPLTYTWFKLSGGVGKIESPYESTTIVKGLKKGKYLFRLIATDSTGAKSSDEVIVVMHGGPVPVIAKASKKSTPKVVSSSQATVLSPVVTNTPPPDTTQVAVNTYTPPVTTTTTSTNNPPLSSAGPDKTITLPESSVTLYGNGADSDGSISSYSWVQLAGGHAFIVYPSSANTDITGLVEGTYVFELTVTDDKGATNSDTVQVIVKAKGVTVTNNNPPSADAGDDQNIILPASSVTLTGSGTDTDGTIVSYLWTKLEGDTATITSPTSATTTVTDLTEGSYVFQLLVTDDKGATDSSTVAVNVTAD